MTGILSPVHVVFLLVIVLLLFGAKRLPEFGQSLGSGLRGFKESLDGTTDERPELTAGEVPTPVPTAEAASRFPISEPKDP